MDVMSMPAAVAPWPSDFSAANSDNGRDDRSSVDKAIAILAAFGPHADSGLGVSQLARRASLSKSTAFRVLAMLERNGVVEKVGSDYCLGARLHELGRSVYPAGHDRIRDQLIPFVTDLYEATRETVHLAALHNTDVVYLAKLYGHRQVKSPSRIGGRVPAYPTAVGKAILAYNPEAVDQTLIRGLVQLTQFTVADADALGAQLASVRMSGVAMESEEVVDGLACLAAPVFGSSGRPVAALSISTPPARLDRRAFEPVLRRVASQASKAISRRPSVAPALSA
jgi:IclR family transcriptional regulator, KDG regulon repressor